MSSLTCPACGVAFTLAAVAAVPRPVPPAAEFTFTAAPVTACPVHHLPWRQVPAGVSKRTGAAYGAFQTCPERDCDQRPA